MLHITFTFYCVEFGTQDMLDPQVTVEIEPGRHLYQRALEMALRVFDDEYADRMEILHIIDGGL